jgi:hypothetical protein
MDLSYFIDDYNDGGEEYIQWFGDLHTFLDILDKKKQLDKLDIDIDTNDDSLPSILAWYVKSGKYSQIKDKIINQLSDIKKVGDKYFLVLDNMSELSVLFSDSGRDSSKDYAERILDNEEHYEPFWDTTDDVYRDVIDELNDNNLKSLAERIIKELSGQQLSPETEEMELIAAEQGHNDYWEINNDNVDRIIEDEESMMSLLNDELSDLKSELYSLHNSAYNSAYESEVYNEVWKELSEYVNKGEWVGRPHGYKTGVTVYDYVIDVTNQIDTVVQDYILENEGYGYTDTPYYHGSYISLITELQGRHSNYDKLRLRIPDYPDGWEVDKNINEMFNDYI